MPEEKSTKQEGRFTEPDLPGRVVLEEGAIRVEHYYRGGDHGPPHLHVFDERTETRIGQNGKPLRNDPPLTTAQQELLERHRRRIRRAIRKIGRWYWFDNLP